MRAAWLENGGIELREVDTPRPGPEEALLRVHQTGVCGTDLALARGLYGFRGVPGHELIATVVAGPSELVDRRAVVDINAACGRCGACRRGHRKHCQSRRVLGIRDWQGGFADWVCAPSANVHPVPPALDDDRAVFAEPLAAALDVIAQAPLPDDGRVLVVGPGRLGQLVVRVLLAEGARVTCLGRGRAALGRLPSAALGLADGDEAPVQSFDLAVDCSGSPAGTRAALDALRARGRLVLKSTHGADAAIDLTRIVVDEIRIVGSRCGDIRRALAWLEAARVDPAPLVDARYSLARVAEAFAHSARAGAMKVLVAP